MKIQMTESFLYNDLELIISARDGQGQGYVAIYSGDLTEGFEYTTVPVSQESLEAFREKQIDLRTLMTEKGKVEWYVMTVKDSYGNVEMQRQTGLLTETDRLPEAGYHPAVTPDERIPVPSVN